MIDKEKFYRDYDEIAPNIFKPYNDFLTLGASVIPFQTKTVGDLGIGTGNFALAVKKRLPRVSLSGIDKNPEMAPYVKEKLGIDIEVRDIFQTLPQVDYFVSSLATHHFKTPERKEKLMSIVSNARGFVNFDIFLDDIDLEQAIDLVTDFARKAYPDEETLDNIRKEMRENDNPMPLEEVESLFINNGLEFEILGREKPFAVYHAYWPTRNR